MEFSIKEDRKWTEIFIRTKKNREARIGNAFS